MAVIPTGMGFNITVLGTKRLIDRVNNIKKRVVRSRTVGVSRAGKKLYERKRLACKMGLYGGKEVGPNTYRFGWAYLGPPTSNVFTGAVLNAHRLGKRVNGAIDRIEVVLDTAKAPHAALIHGPMNSETNFYNPMIRRFVKTRPWMKISAEDHTEAYGEIIRTYFGR